MINLSKEFLVSIGVELDDEHYALFVEHIDETLYERIENGILRTLSPEQIQELAALRNSDESSVWQWLQSNVPPLNEIVRAEVDALLADIVRSSDHL